MEGVQGALAAPLFEPDTWEAKPDNWIDVPARARFVLSKIQEWNDYYGVGEHNHYSRPAVQSYVLIKTLPYCHPWINVRYEYWHHLALHTGGFTIMSWEDDFAFERMEKSSIVWGMPVESVLEWFAEVDRMGREDGSIITFAEWRARQTRAQEARARMARLSNRAALRRRAEYRRYHEEQAGRIREAQRRNEERQQDPMLMEIESEEDDLARDPEYLGEESCGSSSDSGYARESFRLD